jgi:hypothetical protein
VVGVIVLDAEREIVKARDALTVASRERCAGSVQEAA